MTMNNTTMSADYKANTVTLTQPDGSEITLDPAELKLLAEHAPFALTAARWESVAACPEHRAAEERCRCGARRSAGCLDWH